jgi:hypothetical protein
MYAQEFLNAGFSGQEVRRMVVTNSTALVEHLTTISMQDFGQMLREHQVARADEDRRHFRAVDRLAGSCSPMQLDFVPVSGCSRRGQ